MATITQKLLLNLVTEWELKAGRYFVLEETESDTLGKKFYHSAAVALANCADDLTRLVHSEQLADLPEDANQFPNSLAALKALLETETRQPPSKSP